MYAHKQSYRGHCCPQRRTAVRKEQQRNARYRHYADNHADINDKMKKKHAQNAACNVISEYVFDIFYDEYNSDNYYQK